MEGETREQGRSGQRAKHQPRGTWAEGRAPRLHVGVIGEFWSNPRGDGGGTPESDVPSFSVGTEGDGEMEGEPRVRRQKAARRRGSSGLQPKPGASGVLALVTPPFLSFFSPLLSSVFWV